MKMPLFAAAVALSAALPVRASGILTLWNFNASNLTPAIGSGTAVVLGTTGSFASGAGSSDPADPDQAWNTTNYPTQGTGDKTEGVQFNVSTLGMTNIGLSFDNRQSNTASKYLQVQYSLDGNTFVDAPLGLFTAAGGAVWNNGNSVSFGDIVGADNNANFAIRIVATFAPGTGGYVAAATGSGYGTAGTIRFDMVTVTAAPIPEPGTYALLLAGLAAVGFVARRRA